MLKKLLKAYLKDKYTLVLIIIGGLSWSLTMVKSGIEYSYGMGFWGPNGHDGIWHISLAQSLLKDSWEMPVFAGETIKNYHVGFDLLLGVFHKLTFIPILNLYFQILPVVFALIIGFLVYFFVFSWRRSRIEAFWATFFLYFGGSFGWIYTFAKTGQFGGESMFWSQQAISTLINPPFALSLIFLFLGLISLVIGLENENKRLLVLSTFCFGILVQVKIYAGLLVIGSLFATGFIELFMRRKTEVLKVFVGVLILSVLLFSDLSESTGNIIIYKPFWFLESLFASPDRFYWPRFAEALTNYKLGGVWIKGSFAYLLAFLIFLVGNLGTRIISIFWLWGKGVRVSNYNYIDIIFVLIIVSGFLLPILFVQSGTPWNTIQFLYYSILFLGILAGVWFGQLLEKLKNKIVLRYSLSILIIILTIPTTLGTLLYNYLPSRPPAMISGDELSALRFLRSQPEGVVLTQPFDKDAADAASSNPPRPLYLYESTAYVSAFSGKTVYLEDEVNLNITGYEWVERQSEAERFFTDPTFDGKYEMLEKRRIRYVYVVKTLQNKYKDLYLEPNKIFENSHVLIYKFD